MRICPALIMMLALLPEAEAQNQATPSDDVWQRILARLEALPDRWDQLPEPAVPPSGRLPERVLDAATEGEREAADALLSRLVRTPPQQRARVFAEARDQHALSEVVLWWPLHIARQQQVRSFDEAALTLDAWLQLAEHVGRRDVLLRGAGAVLDLASRRLPPPRLAAVAQRWRRLSPGPPGIQGTASLEATHARILFLIGRNHEALDTYRTVRQRYLAMGDRSGQGDCWAGEADVRLFLGQKEEARAAYRRARALFQEIDDKLGQSRSWNGEANVLVHLGRSDEALHAVRQARALAQDIGDRLAQGDSWVGEARALFYLGQVDGALAASRQARPFFVDIGHTLGQGASWHGEAEALLRHGHNEDALNAFRQARALFEDVGYKVGQGNSWHGEAKVLYLLGNYDGALNAFRQARGLSRDLGHTLGEGNSWHGEARVLFELGQLDGALNAFRQARALFQSFGSKMGQGTAWRGEADVLFTLGHNDGALEAYRQARALFEDVGAKQGQGNAWRGQAEVLLRLGALGPALHAAENAARLAREGNSVENELLARMTEARILLASKQEHRAIRRAENALTLLRRWRQIGVSDLDRTAMSEVDVPYDLLIPLLASKHELAVEKALALAEEAHAPVLLDLLVTGGLRPDDTRDPLLIEERRNLQHRLARLDRELRDTITPGQRQRLLHDRAALDAQLELNELLALGSRGSTFVNGVPIDPRTRRKLVRDVGPILLYYVAENETVAFLLMPGQRTPIVRNLGLPRHQLQSDMRTLRQALANSPWEQAAREQQRALFDRLVAPFADALAETPRLTIVPHGPLHELPFEALLDAHGLPLFERWHVTVTPSLSALHTLRQRRATRQPSPRENAFLGIAAGTGLSLPYREVDEASTWFGPTARIIGQHSNSRHAYTELAPDARHVLISSHGKHVAKSRSGYLELGGPDGVATRLTAGDIAHIPLRAELVTLAACETARGEAMQSDERLDLTRAFLIAGADAVLATRWRVPEHPSTRQFLLDFYRALHQGGPGGTRLRKDEALTEARRRSRARGDQAQLWAAWVLVGDAG